MGDIIDLDQKRQEKLLNEAQEINNLKFLSFLGRFTDTKSYMAIKNAKDQLMLGSTYRDYLIKAEQLSIREAMDQLQRSTLDDIKSRPTWYVALWDRTKSHLESSLNL